MELLHKILESDEKEIDSIVQQAIEEANTNATKVKRLGFLDYGKLSPHFKGFIPLDTRIKYSSLVIEDYGMQTTDFMYEFAHFIKKRPYIKSQKALVYYLERFIDSYFGTAGEKCREQIFYEDVWRFSRTDEEFFVGLAENKIGDLKHTGAAQCTERSAVAQQILSLFGTESYYCIGCIRIDDFEEAHCFNVIKRKNDYALLDYSCATSAYNKDCDIVGSFPFVAKLSNEEFQKFMKSGTVKNFRDYVLVGGEEVPLKRDRLYVVDSCRIDENTIQTGKNLAREVTSETEDVQLLDKVEQDISMQQKRLQNSKNENDQML